MKMFLMQFHYSIKAVDSELYTSESNQYIYGIIKCYQLSWLVFLQVSSTDIVGGVLLQSPFLRDFDEREIFCLYLYPGNSQDRKVCLHYYAMSIFFGV